MSSKTIKLTKLQREVLEALRDGAMITIDRMNLPWLGERQLAAQTRYFLTENRLVTRRDPTRSAETSGNGFILSEKGRALLEVSAPIKPVANSGSVDS